jgi:hypothetical protein
MFNCGSDITSDHKIFYDSLKVTSVPDSFGFDSFYKKYIDANGVPVISSDKAPDAAVFSSKTNYCSNAR